jgi:hypothetical protein
MFLHFTAKMSYWILEKQINIKCCVKSGRNSSEICTAMLSKAYGRGAMEKSSISEWHKGPMKACMLKSQMKTYS